MDNRAVHMLVLITLALVLVLLLRKPVRRWLGANVAFQLWTLPVLLPSIAWLPSLELPRALLPVINAIPVSVSSFSGPLPTTMQSQGLGWLWVAGTIFLLLRLCWHYARLMRVSCILPIAMRRALQIYLPERLRAQVCLHPAGPAVLCAFRCRILLPADFLDRFDATERRLVIQHELTHLQRHDPLWSLFAELIFTMFWFHPLMWLALSRFRLDQELACDETVLRQSPHELVAYTHTSLNSTGVTAVSALIPWLAEPQLKERLMQIQKHQPGALRHRLGFISVAAAIGMLTVALAMQAQAAQTGTVANFPDAQYNAHLVPHYPVDAIKAKEQGTVILTLIVDKDGKVSSFKVDPATNASARLVKAAGDAVMQWHFYPALKDGLPVESYAYVPIKFFMNDLPGTRARSNTNTPSSS